MKLYRSSKRGDKKNTLYEIETSDLAQAARYDHIGALCKDSRRANANFISSDVLMMDVDNSGIEEETEWVLPEDLKNIFFDVEYYTVGSRNDWKAKETESARPRFHVYLPLSTPVTDAQEYVRLKEKAISVFPGFDRGAKDATRFFFGVENPAIQHFKGSMMVDMVLAGIEPENAVSYSDGGIPQGQRNSALSRRAAQILKKYGDTARAREAFKDAAGACVPPLGGEELRTIWGSALKFFKKEIAGAPGYIPPEEFEASDFSDGVKPGDFSDVGQAAILAREYGDRLAWTSATRYLVFDGRVWRESEIRARGLAQALTTRQLKEAIRGFADVTDKKSKEYEAAKAYLAHVKTSRSSAKIAAALKEAEPRIAVEVDKLDHDNCILNTPAGTVDLRTGEIRAHDPADYCTKITGVTPGTDGTDIWRAFLDVITCGDQELADYLQVIAGRAAVGEVYTEGIIIAYGSGKNGKSTFFNTLDRVLGDYAGGINADVLTTGYRGKNWEAADLRGKRFVIAPELAQGARLNEAMVKTLCSTDKIKGEKKFKDAFIFEPTHTIIMYTNYLPKVGSSDVGTWRRLVVVPFGAEISAEKQIEKYEDFLFEKAGSAILSWVIDGAVRYIAARGKITPPKCVVDAVEAYRKNNDWLSAFLEECCEVDTRFRVTGSELEKAYTDFCSRAGHYRQQPQMFIDALLKGGFEKKKTKRGALWLGLRVRVFEDFEDDVLL